MEQKILAGTLAGTLVLAGLALASQRLGSSGDSSHSVLASSPTKPSIGVESRTAVDLAIPGDREASRRKDSNEASVATENAPSEAIRTETTRWMDGRVSFPPGAPLDDTLTVVALGERTAPPDATPNYREVMLPSSRSWDSYDVVARAPVDSTGNFRISVPADAPSTIGLDLDGRYLFLNEALSIDLAETSSAAIEMAPQLGGVIRGTVALPLGVDDPPAIMHVGAFGTRLIGSSTSRAVAIEDTLTFELNAFPVGQGFRLWANSDIYPSLFHPDDITVEAGQTTHVRLSLTAGARVQGRVVDESGAGLAGVQISGDPGASFAAAPGAGTTYTDSTGRFDLRGLTPRPQTVSARLQPYIHAESETLELEDGVTVEQVNIVLESGLSLMGTVLWPDGSPANGARLSLAPLEPGANSWHLYERLRSEEGSARSLADGSFEVKGLDSGSYALYAELASPDATGATSPLWSARVASVDSGVTNLTLTLQPPMGCSGIALDDSGEPLDTFTATARRVDWPAWFEGASTSVEQTFSNSEGKFTLVGIDAGEWDVTIRAEGHLGSEEQRASVSSLTANVIAGPFTLTRTASLTGRVLDPNGVPVSGAQVAVEAQSYPGVSSVVESDADGRFTLPSVGPGTVVVRTTSLDWADAPLAEFALEPGDAHPGYSIRMTEGGAITGVIYDDLGAPDPDRDLLLQSDNGVFRELRSDSAGRFLAEHLTPGSYQVVATPESGGWMTGGADGNDMGDMLKGVHVAVGEVIEGEVLELVLGATASAPVRVHGTVLRNGEPVARANVMAVSETRSLLESMRTDTADGEGRFELELSEPGDYTFVLLGQDDFQSEVDLQVSIPEVERFELDLVVPSGSISGRLVASDGSNPNGSPVWVRREDSTSQLSVLMARGTVNVESDGSFTIDALHPGRYAISATGVDSALTTLHGVQVVDGQTTDSVEIVLPAAGNVEGQVLDDSGRPVAGATVILRNETGQLLYRLDTVTDRKGEFSVARVPVGRVFVSAHTRESASRTVDPVLVRASEPTRAKLELAAGAHVLVSFADAEGAPIRCAISARNEAGHDYANEPTSGELEHLFSMGLSTAARRVGPLPPGRYTVEAHSPDGRTATRTIDVAGDREYEVELRPDP